MPLAIVGLGAFSPGSHKPIVQTRAQRGTNQRNQSAGPLLHNFSAGASGNTLDHPRNESVDYFFLYQFAADVDSGRAGGGDPEFGDFAVGIELKSVHQAQLL